MKKIFKWIGIVLGMLILGIVVIGLVSNEPKPQGTTGPAADALARKMEQAINKAAWDSTRYVQWTFAGRNSFIWDRERELVQVNYGKTKVLLRLANQTGIVFEDGKQLDKEAAKGELEKAWAFFCNDSFWLNAPAKAFDAGTERAIVPLENGEEGLMITYNAGGVTPGDSYLWILDKNGLPKSWKMWVSIIPIGGGEFSWEAWETLSTGAKVATLHKGMLELPITDLEGGQTFEALGLEEDPFGAL